jgi:hypothetical protein
MDQAARAEALLHLLKEKTRATMKLGVGESKDSWAPSALEVMYRMMFAAPF